MTRLGALLAAIVFVLAAGDASAAGVTVKNPDDIAAALNVQTPFSVLIQCSNPANSGCTKTITVPAQERWVIKTISGYCAFTNQTNNKLALVYLQTVISGAQGAVIFGPSAPATSGSAFVSSFTFSGETYADPGSNVVFLASTSLNQGAGAFDCAVYVIGQSIQK